MTKKIIICFMLIWMIATVMIGCSSFNGKEMRREHAENYPKQLAEETRDVLSEYRPLDLNDCIRIAMQNSLSVKSAEIQQRIARLEKKVSFANFLPAVSLNYQKTWWDPQPQIKFGPSGFPMHDKNVRDVTWNIQLSIFNPATWFLYSMHTRGYEIAELVTDFTRQAIALQVTAQYFQCLSLEQMLTVLKSQLVAAQTLEKELAAYRQEGLVSDWKAEQGRVLVLARRTELHRVQRSLNQAKAELLAGMGLDPTSDVTLETQMPLDAPGGSLDDLIMEALLNHSSLAISDRQVAIEKEKLKAAVTAFLPQLMGFASRVDTSDSHQVFTNYWMGGLSAAITVFDGLANVNYYQAAKELQKDAILQRKQATLTLMLQVIRAMDQVELAQDQMELTRKMNEVASMRLAEVKQQYEQGLIQASDMLVAAAEADEAEIRYLQTRFQYQTSISVLTNVMGKTQTVFEESTNESR
jgi:outer membrane protein TolC